jgi:hypothetical protein
VTVNVPHPVVEGVPRFTVAKHFPEFILTDLFCGQLILNVALLPVNVTVKEQTVALPAASLAV